VPSPLLNTVKTPSSPKPTMSANPLLVSGDDPSPADIRFRGWKKSWPHYIRVEGAEFIDGRLDDGVSLNQMMSELGALSFASTKRCKLAGENPNPRTAYMQKPAMELTPESMAWLNDGCNFSFRGWGSLARGRCGN
jgi:hypothetical protein